MNNHQTAFQTYLSRRDASPATIRNYLSDFNQFWAWLSLECRKTKQPPDLTTNNLPQILTAKTVRRYQFYLLNNGFPAATIKRRLSSLRRWGEFAIRSNWLTQNPFLIAKHIQIPQIPRTITNDNIFRKFKSSLEKEGTNHSTIRNYMADIRHFTTWLGNQ